MSRSRERAAMRALLIGSLRDRRRELKGLLFWSGVQAIPAFFSGRLIAQSIDHGFLVHRSATGFGWLALLGVSFIIGAIGSRRARQRLSDIVEPFRDELVTMAVRGSMRRSTLPGAAPDTAAVARLTLHVEIVREAYASALMVVQSFLVTSVSALVGLASLSAPSLLFVLPPLVLGLALFAAVLGRTASFKRASILADERIAEEATVLASGLRDIVACGAEEPVAASVGYHIDTQARATWDVARFTAVQTVAIALGGWLPVVLLLLGGRWLLRHGATTGVLLGALTYLVSGVQPALQTLIRGIGTNGLWLFVTLGRVVSASVDDASADGDRRPDLAVVAPQRAPVSIRYPHRHDLHLRHVTFRYGPWADPVIRDFDLDVPAGDHLAIVGPSGVGKSTLAGILSGLLRPQEGQVRMGGLPIAGLNAATLARRRVLIPQEAYVFGDSLWENLTYLRPTPRLAQVDDAVDRIGFRPVLDRLGGYDAELQPSALSAGERQLVTLVRAYLSPARLALLDEATCHLDPVAEGRVEEAFAARHATLIVIAHRISSALRARRILVMDGDRTLIGSHEDLLAESPMYADMVGHWESGVLAGG